MTRAFLVLAALLGAHRAEASPASLDDVLRSVRDHHPAAAAAHTAIDRAEGQLLAAEGAFDPRARARVASVASGYYDTTTVDTEMRVLTPWHGASPFVGWRLGRGTFPSYDGKLDTLDGGELRVGLDVPLLQGRVTDRARTDLRKAGIAKELARAEVDQRTIDLARDAEVAYWDWVAALHRLEVRRTGLAIALERERQIEQGVAAGLRAPIEVTDNRRAVVAREAILVAAERDVRRAGLELSLLLRTADGRPLVPDAAVRPSLRTDPEPLTLEADVATALTRGIARAPRLRELRARQDLVDADLALARDTLRPKLDMSVSASRGIGPAESLLADRSDVALTVAATFELPVGRRTARGNLMMARADSARVAAELKFAIDRVAVDVHATHAELSAARARSRLAERNAELSELLADAERTRFARGDSTVLLVNLREEAAADAAAQSLDARADVLRQRARLAALLGEEPR